MPIEDEEFIKALRATFKVEARDHLQGMSGGLLELEKAVAPAQASTALESVYRSAHSLKGAARAVDFSDIEAICQALESIFSIWKRQATVPSSQAFDVLHRAMDAVQELLSESKTGPNARPTQPLNDLIRSLGQLQFVGGASSRRDTARLTPPELSPSQIIISTDPISSPPLISLPPSLPSASPLIDPSPSVDIDKTPALETVRISTEKLDARLLEAEEMLSLKAMANQRASELREIVLLFDCWRKEWAKVSSDARELDQSLDRHVAEPAVPTLSQRTAEPSTPDGKIGFSPRDGATVPASLLGFFDWNAGYVRSLEHRLVALASRADQDRHVVARRVDDLLEESKKLLMLPFSITAGIFPKLVRDLCRDEGKETELIIRGGDVDIDKRILEEMKDAIIHLLRNCVNHGIEAPAERARQKKPTRATIIIAVSPINGNKVQILVSDDGAGIDIQGVKQSAIRHGIISEIDAEGITDADAMNLIFQSEVSTSPMVTAVSGRGLGMAIVREKTEKLAGRITVESRRGGGTTFRMLLPLTLATFRGILVTVSDHAFVVPTVNIDRVLRVPAKEIQTIENGATITVRDRVVPLCRLHEILEIPAASHPVDNAASSHAVVITLNEQTVAFSVDEILHEEEVLVKPLRRPLVRVRNIAGATILGSGRIASILNVADLMKSARIFRPHLPVQAASPAKPAAVKREILVVEDSVTSRMLLRAILESAGYRVRIAVDGIEAYATLREHPVDLVVSDVEMPRMNGFDLTARIRSDPRLGDLPVVLVTALESREERERGIDAGANAYLIKSRFDQGNLLETVQRLI